MGAIKRGLSSHHHPVRWKRPGRSESGSSETSEEGAKARSKKRPAAKRVRLRVWFGLGVGWCQCTSAE